MTLRIVNRTRATELASRAEVADSSEKRRRGLLKHTSLPVGEGLWIVPCEGVHCFFMKFTIDVVYLSKSKQVLKLCPGLRPWRLSMCLRAHSVLELPEGLIAATGTELGDQLEFEKIA